MRAATTPRRGGGDAQLLALDELGRISHHPAADVTSLLRRGDLVVANDAATIPASLQGIHLPTGRPVEVRLAARRSLGAQHVARFTAVVFGAGDFHTPTEHRPDPPRLQPGDALLLGSIRGTIAGFVGHRRLVDLQFRGSVEEIWEAIARHGRPIQYAYVAEPLAVWDTWTSIASRPVAFEAPSAGFIINWALLRAIRKRGVQFATVTHAAGISSTGDQELDALLPLDEPYDIPSATAALIRQAVQRGGRIIAVGTTVVRALEHAAAGRGWVAPGSGLATNRITSQSRLRVADAIVSGVHERGSSHYELLRAFQNDDALEHMTLEAEAHDYRAHEFGDAVFVSRAAVKLQEHEGSLSSPENPAIAG
jgi:S-adenosylmethionine:tRNA ribosyltransferase-isomerase